MLRHYNNLSAGAQNVTGAYVLIIMFVNNALTWQSSCEIANNARKTAKAVQGYNFEVHDVIKYTQKHRATNNYITCKPDFCVT